MYRNNNNLKNLKREKEKKKKMVIKWEIYMDKVI